jgi:redox-sensitive bicupin YhaK (pirin superfamily)
MSGKPLEEPVARYSAIVMNTQEQLRIAFEELRAGAFLDSSATARALHCRAS